MIMLAYLDSNPTGRNTNLKKHCRFCYPVKDKKIKTHTAEEKDVL